MRKEIVSIPGETPARHLSRAVRFGNLVFVAGTTGRNPVTKEMPEDIQGQTKQALETIKGALAGAGASMQDVLKMTCYISDLGEKKGFDEVYISYFPSDPPARATVQMASLGPGVKIEIETIAGIPS